MELPVHDQTGRVVDRVTLDDAVFGSAPREAVVHQAMVMYLANQRQGTADTKTRGQVAGGGHKPYRQKGTGRARQGSIRAPQFRGGGVVFGPHPRDFRQQMPKKMRRLALCSVLSVRAAEGKLVLLQQLHLEKTKTKEMKGILECLGVRSSALVVTPQVDQAVYRSAHNLSRVRVLPASLVNALDVLQADRLILPVEAARRLEERLHVAPVLAAPEA